MNIFKTKTLTWKQVGAIKWGSISFAFLVAHYWPVVAEWTTFWWVVFVLTVLYVFSFYFKK